MRRGGLHLAILPKYVAPSLKFARSCIFRCFYGVGFLFVAWLSVCPPVDCHVIVSDNIPWYFIWPQLTAVRSISAC
jgi:hypothetical protein